MGGRHPRRVVLQGADESLRSLLSDVLGDMGFALRGLGEGGERPDVVLALVQRADGILGVLQAARREAVPTVVLLPFADERLRHLALTQGARGCYALGTPLEELRRVLCDLLSDAPGMGARGRHDD